MLLKICSKCGNMITYGNTYCKSCAIKVEETKKEYNKKACKRYNSKRDPKYVRFYNSTNWRSLSNKYRQDKQYRCEICMKYATEVHHVIPIQTPEGWDRRLDYDNLQCICHDCHSEKHNRFHRRNKNGRGR